MYLLCLNLMSNHCLINEGKLLLLEISKEYTCAGRFFKTVERHKCKLSIGCTNCESRIASISLVQCQHSGLMQDVVYIFRCYAANGRCLLFSTRWGSTYLAMTFFAI